MKISKILGLALCAGAFVMLTTSCGLFESEKDNTKRFYHAPGSGTGKDANAGRGAGNPNFDPNGTGNLNTSDKFISGSSGLDNNNYDGFGRPVPGVKFTPLYFNFDQNYIEPNEMGKIDAVVNYLNANPRHGVVIEGNCDVRGTEEYNRSLGDRRSTAAKEAMEQAGIAPQRIKSISNGKMKLADQGTGEESHRLNRRDEFIAVELLAQ